MARSTSDKVEQGIPQPATQAVNDLKFEAALAELEQLVHGMEGGQLSLEESIAAYRRGSELLKHCQQQLSEAERRIQILENGTLRDFDAVGSEGK